MTKSANSQQNILSKLGIEKLKPMQEDAQLAISSSSEIVLLSPTGTGKTLAFLLPIIAELDKDCSEIQVLILVPSRELAIQIEQVIREMGTGYKTNAFYGGRSGSKDKADLKHRPAILIGTPGRIADHLRRKRFSVENLKTIVLDEFDKSLEVGFEAEMTEIISALPKVNKKILTSATQGVTIPKFVGLQNPVWIDYLDEEIINLELKTVLSPTKDKLETLVELLQHIGNQPGIIFCNYKDSIQRLSNFLTQNNINHACFYGGMEQQDRERALIKFRNGTHQLLIATDLAARGIDIPEIKFIIHYHLPLRKEEFTHRNGRTARMNNKGSAYIIQWEKETSPDFIKESKIIQVEDIAIPKASKQIAIDPIAIRWSTLFISGGRRDKISKGDIAGLFLKQGNLEKEELGVIELKQDCAFVAVAKSKTDKIIQLVDNTKLKKKKIRVKLI